MSRPYFFPPGKICVRSEFFRYVRRTSRHVRTTADRDDQFRLERGTRTSEPTSSFRDPGRRRVFELRLHIAATESFAGRRRSWPAAQGAAVDHRGGRLLYVEREGEKIICGPHQCRGR